MFHVEKYVWLSAKEIPATLPLSVEPLPNCISGLGVGADAPYKPLSGKVVECRLENQGTDPPVIVYYVRMADGSMLMNNSMISLGTRVLLSASVLLIAMLIIVLYFVRLAQTGNQKNAAV